MKKILPYKVLLLLLLTSSQLFSQWANTQNITGIENSHERFGNAVSISGDGSVLAVGAYRDGNIFDDYNNLDQSGSVRIYEKDASNDWIQTTEINFEELIGSHFGYSLSLSNDGNTLVVGAPNEGNGQIINTGSLEEIITTSTGLVKIFSKNNLNEWVNVGSISGENENEYFGWSVAISDDGQTLISGAYGYSNETGITRVYKKGATNNWVKSTELIGTNEGDKSGYSVSISSYGNIVASGSFGHDNSKGTTRIYSYQNEVWTQMGTDIDGENNDDYSGCSISLSGNGDTILIGAYNYNDDGTARLYSYANNIWTKETQINAVESSFEHFGFAVSLTSDAQKMAIGASQSGSNVGTSRVYKKENNSWSQVGEDIVGVNDNEFSSSALSLTDNGNTLASGAYAFDTNAGIIRLYEFSDSSLHTNDSVLNNIPYSIQNKSIVVNSQEISISIHDFLGRNVKNQNLNGAYLVTFLDQQNGKMTTKKLHIQ